MEILAIDPGSYSIKLLHSRKERKGITVQSFREIIISDFLDQFDNETPLFEIQATLIKSYLDDLEFSGKNIITIPNDYLTSRYLTLPIVNRKKIDLMLPFQLDENLPFPIGNSHYVTQYYKYKKSTNIIVTITQKSHFSQLHQILESQQIKPAIISSEISTIDSFVYWSKQSKNKSASIYKKTYCILDIGHHSTRAYFVNNQELVSNHISYTAGAEIDRAISENYNISIKEASKYKHEQSFFLTEELYDKVNNNQKKFSIIMKDAFWPLVLDIRRWELGHKVKFTTNIKAIYLIGGSSKIKNISNFLSEALGIQVQNLDLYNSVIERKTNIEQHNKQSFLMAKLISLSQVNKRTLPNFLTGDFSSKYSNNIPVASTLFLGTRTFIIALILAVSLIVDRGFLHKDLNKNKSRLNALIKNPKLELNKKQQRKFKRNTKSLLGKIKKENKLFTRSIKEIKTKDNENAVKSLVQLSQIVQNNEMVDLTKFESSLNNISALFKSDKIKELETLKTRLQKSSLNITKLDIEKNNLTVELERN